MEINIVTMNLNYPTTTKKYGSDRIRSAGESSLLIQRDSGWALFTGSESSDAFLKSHPFAFSWWSTNKLTTLEIRQTRGSTGLGSITNKRYVQAMGQTKTCKN